MKIVMHLISTSVFSGAENVACQIINLFKNDLNYKMVYVSTIGLNKKSLEDRNIKYYELTKFDYFQIKKAINTLKPDIIHAHDPKASVMAALFSKKAKIIAHIHGNHKNMRSINLKTIIFNIFCKNFSSIIWVSKSALDNYKFKDNILNKSTILYNVINSNELLEKIKSDTEEYYNYDLIYLGRLTYVKNPQRLIKIIRDISTTKKGIKVAIVGNGDCEKKIKTMISKYNLQNNVDLYGFVSNPYKILASSKMMIMTSRYEGTPMCALEAYALNVPIISTPTDGLVDIIDNNITGFISNNDAEIVNKILELLDDPRKLTILRNNVKRKSKILNDTFKYKINIEKNYK